MVVQFSFKDSNSTLNRIFDMVRAFAFCGFYVLCLWLVSAYLYNTTGVSLPAGVAVFIGIAAVTWWNPLWSLFIFIACVPLVNGLFQLGLFPVCFLSFWFAAIYLTWITKRFLYLRQSKPSHSPLGNLIDMLSAVVLFSLITIMLQYPPDYLSNSLWSSYPVMRQTDPMFGPFAAFILLQGLFLYRIMESEITNRKAWNRFVSVFFVHVFIVLVFYLIQAAFNLPVKHKGLILFSPFDDVHSWGSYIVLLLFVFWGISGTGVPFRRMYAVTVSVLFTFLIFLSSSIATIGSLLIVGSMFVFCRYGTRKFLVFFGAICTCLVVLNLFPSLIEKSDHYVIERYARRLLVKNVIHERSPLLGRYMSADQALGILQEYPVTGSGIGTFRRISPYYHYSDTPHPQRLENAHNYYLQFAADLGIPALIVFLSIIFCTLRAGFYQLVQDDGFRNFRRGLLFGFGAYLITMLTGHPLLLSPQQLLFWFVAAMLSVHYQVADNTEPVSSETVDPQ